MFPWDLYVKLLEYSKERGMTVTDVTVDALTKYLLEKTTQNHEIEELKEKVTELEKERSGGEHEFDDLEKTIKKIVQKDSEI
jgi:predicted  nucleic acid-binding Zn-ribbon protein